jgi:hypothetical protein
MLFDALTGIVWADDSQVAFVHCNKVYAWNDRPGAHVVVDFLTDVFLQVLGENYRAVTNVLDSF